MTDYTKTQRNPDPAVIEEVAYRMFARNVVDFVDTEKRIAHAWLDPQVRNFWIEQAEAVADDLARRGA